MNKSLDRILPLVRFALTPGADQLTAQRRGNQASNANESLGQSDGH
jgi:hypothetical protein